MYIYAILAHDKKDSLNHYLFSQTTKYLETRNMQIDFLNLYDYKDEIPFYSHDRKVLENNNFFQENKKRFMDADTLLIVHPIYWYSVPGILKTWLDLITNFAWKYEGGFYAKPLHKIKKALVINTSMSPKYFRTAWGFDPAMSQLKNMFKFIGLPQYYFYRIGNVGQLSDEKVAEHLEQIFKLADKLIF